MRWFPYFCPPLRDLTEPLAASPREISDHLLRQFDRLEAYRPGRRFEETYR